MKQQRNPNMDFEGRLLAELRALVAERGAAEAASGQARTGATPPPRPARGRRLALGGVALATALTACVVGVLLSSGPATQPAAAEVLRQTAAVAEAASSPAEAPPGPGQFLYVKTKVVELQGWLPDGPGMGPKTSPRYFTTKVPGIYPEAPAALVPTLKETWTGRDGATRERETLGRIEFFSEADQRRWEEAGSPPPYAYDPDEHDVGRDSSGRAVKDFESRSWRGSREFSYVRKLAKLPTEPEALRQALEHRPAPGQPPVVTVGAAPADSFRGRSTIEGLINVLSEPITSPALRAAAFNALAEIPGIELERDVTDVAGRRGDAIAWVAERGFGRRFVFDPRTSRILSQAEMIFDAEAAGYPGVPDGTVFRATAYLRSGIVDSTDERP